MLVKDFLHKIERKEMTVKVLANQLKVSDRTVQNKIKNLGYKWAAKKGGYEYIGNAPEPLEVDFRSLIDQKQSANKSVAKKEVSKSEKEVSAASIASNKIVKTNRNDNEYDAIDMLLQSKPRAKKVYRGFYFDEDVIKIIDSVDSRKKSELVNQALRKVFTDKDLL